jgi:hypothetical protein
MNIGRNEEGAAPPDAAELTPYDFLDYLCAERGIGRAEATAVLGRLILVMQRVRQPSSRPIPRRAV